MSITPAEFVRRLYKQLQTGKGMRFSPEEMDLLAEMGAIDAVSKFAADWVKRQSEERLATTRAEHAGASAETYKATRSGQHHELTAEEAGDRALELSRPKKRPERSYLSGEAVKESMRRARSRTKPPSKRTTKPRG